MLLILSPIGAISIRNYQKDIRIEFPIENRPEFNYQVMYEKFWDDICEQNGFTKVPKYKLNFEGDNGGIEDKKIEDVFIKIWDKDTWYSSEEMLTILKDEHNSFFQDLSSSNSDSYWLQTFQDLLYFKQENNKNISFISDITHEAILQDNRKNNNQQDEKLKIIFGLDSSRKEIKINCDLGELQENKITNEEIKKAIRKVNPNLEKDFEKDLEIKINRSEKQAEIKHPEYLETIIVNYKPDLIKTINFQVSEAEQIGGYFTPWQSLITKIKDINLNIGYTFLEKLYFYQQPGTSLLEKIEFAHPDCNGSVIFQCLTWKTRKTNKKTIRIYYFEKPQKGLKLNVQTFKPKPTRFLLRKSLTDTISFKSITFKNDIYLIIDYNKPIESSRKFEFQEDGFEWKKTNSNEKSEVIGFQPTGYYTAQGKLKNNGIEEVYDFNKIEITKNKENILTYLKYSLIKEILLTFPFSSKEEQEKKEVEIKEIIKTFTIS
ncbi:MAG: hypothetical protein WJU30_00405 [Candidatus Phytoplasma pruni]